MGSSDGLPGPTDAWITLAGLARDTERISLGTLVSPVTFRDPGMLAISVAQVDVMSGGRVELGLGTGWYEAEHAAYGLAFPSLAKRFEMLEEQLAVISGLWDTPIGETFSRLGTHYTVTDSPGLPKPIRRPPIIIGGSGKEKTPRLAATYADEFNCMFMSVDDAGAQIQRIREACERLGREPGELTYSNALTVCCGENETDLARRAAGIGRDVDSLRERALAGSPAEIIDKLGLYREAGVERIYMQVLDLADLDHIALLGNEVLPHI
jgi:alkanesulfonate monooxygenase